MFVRAHRCCLIAGLVSFAVPGAVCAAPIDIVQRAGALPVIPAPNVTSAACVLHVWPGPDAKSSYSGWFHGGAVDGDKRGIKGYPDMHATALASGVQRSMMERVDWSGQLDRPGLSVVFHNQPPAEEDNFERKTPLIADRPPCYAEAIVHSVFVESAVFSAKTVRVMLIFKLWREPATQQPWNYSTMETETVRLDAGAPLTVEASLKDGFLSAVRKSLHAGYFWH